VTFLAAVAGALALTIGHSVEGRPIVAREVAGATPRVSVLVVGCIHGNEQAGIAVADALEHAKAPDGVTLWIVPALNPDGVAADTRQNAHGVDLNRDFPVAWRPRTGVFASGPRPLSEPEARAAYSFIRRIHPTVTIWFHQHLDLVEKAGRVRRFERLFAASSGLPLRSLGRFGGSAVTWENASFPNTSSFAVELPAGTPTAAQTARYARAVLAVARAATH
jgi:murein peptide amidase A